jgi:hypothetical protein
VTGSIPRRAVLHAAASLFFLAITATWVSSIIAHPAELLPGAAGDNLVFVWNMWWARFALTHEGASLLWTPLLLFPFGADLTLHTNTLLPSVLASPLSDPVVAQNVVIVFNLFLNFVCAYALAFRQTSDWRASIFAGLAFGWAPFFSARLSGHFNLLGAWVLPLCGLAALAVRERPRTLRAAWLGVCLAAAAYMDYYFAIYATALAACLLTHGLVTITNAEAGTRGVKPVIAIVLALLAIDAAILSWVLTTGGGTVSMLGVHASVRGIENPIAIGWLLLIALALVVGRSKARTQWQLYVLRAAIRPTLVSGAVFMLCLLPLSWHAVALWRSGGYATQRYLWRSAPAGIDVSTLFLGNPFSFAYGQTASRWYGKLGVDLVESVAWMSPAVVILAGVGLYRSTRGNSMRVWIAPLVLFGMWSLGPYLYAAGHATTMWLPAVLLRWAPIINNARIPTRGIVVVYLVVAILGAAGLSYLLRSRRQLLAWSLAAVALADLIPAAPAVHFVGRPSIYTVLKAQPSGAVCELPFGLRDGFGEIGRLDPRSMFFQTIHEHALVGGFVARLPPGAADRYLKLPVLGTLIALSAGEPLPSAIPTRQEAREAFEKLGIRYLMLNQTTAPPSLKQYVQALPLRVVAADVERTLFAVEGSHPEGPPKLTSR